MGLQSQFNQISSACPSAETQSFGSQSQIFTTTRNATSAARRQKPKVSKPNDMGQGLQDLKTPERSGREKASSPAAPSTSGRDARSADLPAKAESRVRGAKVQMPAPVPRKLMTVPISPNLIAEPYKLVLPSPLSPHCFFIRHQLLQHELNMVDTYQHHHSLSPSSFSEPS